MCLRDCCTFPFFFFIYFCELNLYLHFCAPVIISGRGCSTITMGFLIKVQDPPVREFWETLSLHQISEVPKPHGCRDKLYNDQGCPRITDTKRQEVII